MFTLSPRVKVAQYFLKDAANVPVLCEYFHALVQDCSLLRPEVQRLLAEKVMMQVNRSSYPAG